MPYQCEMCAFSCADFIGLNKHLLRYHRHERKFTVRCQFEGCEYSTQSWNAYRLHYKNKHKRQCITDDSFVDDLDEIDYGALDKDEAVRKIMACKLLELEARYKLSGAAIKCTSELVSQIVQVTLDGLEKQDCVDVTQLFATEYQRLKLYEEHCNYVPPKSVALGVDTKGVQGRHTLKTVFGQCIPFIPYLTALLHMPDLLKFVEEGLPKSSGDFLMDFKDGSWWKMHPMFGRIKTNCIAINLYYDEIEIVNSLRSRHRTSKVGMFYFSLVNIPVQHRSSLHNMHLVAIAHSRHLRKFGCASILHDFLRGVKRLREHGLIISVNGVDKYFQGDLLVCITDTPAGGFLSGMKESPSFSFKGCRVCEATKEKAQTCFVAKKFLHRDLDIHSQRCDTIEYHKQKSKVKKYWSKQWGINGRSPFQVIDFDFLTCMPYDIMHVLLEGQVPFILALFLHRAVYVDHFFTLSWFNEALSTFPYSYLDKGSQPEPIKKSDLQNNIVKNTASATLTLVYILPHLIGHRIPNDCEHYSNLVLLLELTLLCTSPIIHSNTIGEVELKIDQFYRNFKFLYPTAPIKPKAHQLVHCPTFMHLFGPARNFWAMRWEAKHSEFKSREWKNHKNLPKSLAKKHAISMASHMNPIYGAHKFVYKGDQVSEGQTVSWEGIAKKYSLLAPHIAVNNVYETPQVCVDGHVYRKGVAVVLGLNSQCEETGLDALLPKFGIVETILSIQGQKYIVCHLVTTMEFNWRLNAYRVQEGIVQANYGIYQIKKLTNIWPIPVYRHEGNDFITNRYCTFGNMF